VNYAPGEKSPRHAPETLLSGLLHPGIYAIAGLMRLYQLGRNGGGREAKAFGHAPQLPRIEYRSYLDAGSIATGLGRCATILGLQAEPRESK